MAEIRGIPQLQARLHAIGGTGNASLIRRLGVAAVREQRLLARPHRKTSNLEHSIRLGAVTPTSATTLASANYAAFVEFGTRPHEITPRAAKALAWGGARRLSGSLRSGAKPTHFAKRVHHPGTKPYPFMVPGAQLAVKKTGVDAIVEAWNGAA